MMESEIFELEDATINTDGWWRLCYNTKRSQVDPARRLQSVGTEEKTSIDGISKII